MQHAAERLACSHSFSHFACHFLDILVQKYQYIMHSFPALLSTAAMLLYTTLLLAPLTAAQIVWPVPVTETACNNSPSLCSRSYGKMTHLGAHDSPFVANITNIFTVSGNQFYNSTTQLDAGVRLLSAQVRTDSFSEDPELRLCHTDCILYDAGALQTWLTDIRQWMDANPNEVVTLLLVNGAKANSTRLRASFDASGLSKYAYTPVGAVPQRDWPTLRTMIQAETRLVVFVDTIAEGGAPVPWLIPEFDHVFENRYEITDPGSFSCAPDRPASLANNTYMARQSGRLFMMNHFLGVRQLFDIITPARDASRTTNSAEPSVRGSLGQQMQVCQAAYRDPPNFVLVDWFNVGPAVASVDGWNGVNDVVGRKAVSESILSREPEPFEGSALSSRDTGAARLAMAVALLAVVFSS